MIRITELRLPIEHAPEELEVAILKRLGISSTDLVDFIVFKRSYEKILLWPSFTPLMFL